MGNFYMKSEFQIEWFKNIEEVEEFHDDYFGDGNFIAWHVKGEYSESLCLDENAKETLKRLL